MDNPQETKKKIMQKIIYFFITLVGSSETHLIMQKIIYFFTRRLPTIF